jgi:patatin-like phospholipase/acyl hydrolase
MPDKKLILSIDGGGLRGIIPACMLVELERQTGKQAGEIFSFVAGTSTGAVISAAIAAGIPATQMLDLYVRRAGEVFPQLPWPVMDLKRLILGYMYSNRKLREVLAEESGKARDWTIQNSPIDIMVTGKRVDDGMPWYFVKDCGLNRQRTGKLPLIDCVTASAVAPTYFKPWTVPEANPPGGDRPVGALVDGGVGVAGNPAYQACVEAFDYTGERNPDGTEAPKYRPDETILVSLGTGRFLQQDAHPNSILGWVKWLIGELLDSASEQQTDVVRRNFRDMPFYRLDLHLPRPIGQDGVKHIPELKAIGERFARTIDWAPILAGEPSPFSIGDENTLPRQYKKAVPAV